MQVIKDRRALHQIPELAWELPKTMAYLRNALEGLKCQVFEPVPGALCAWFDFGQDHAIAFRTDCDALPIEEKTGLPFASTHPGKMHACGHDGHMAIALELARRMDAKEAMPHNILIVFQPAEEATGGAKIICETGVFTRYNVQAIFGLHIWPGLEAGVMHSRMNEMMSLSCEVTVDITGKSSHIANPKAGIDALEAATRLYAHARRIEAEVPAPYYRLLNFGHMVSGTVRNAISAHTRMEGSLRTFQNDVFEQMKAALREAAEQVQQQTGCTVSVHFSEGAPAVMNPEELYNRVKKAADFRELEEPSMTAEDFSWYQQFLPGMFFFLGTGETPALHASDYSLDEAILTKGADFFEKLAENFL